MGRSESAVRKNGSLTAGPQRKRVCCLYRVSTKGQVDKDDIPMQKQRCHEFADTMGWDIVKEFSEKGVSGFKVSAKDRDAIQDIQKEAALGTFDILLVFMFDRLGRKDDETPFVVEWFANNGIEVWSAEEGQQRFDSHVDKLMNYIRFWQASGESLKTSVRVKTRMGQIVQEGRYRGGQVAYGYQLVKKGRIGKKDRELYDMEINPDEAPTVQRIFEIADRYGYGGRKIATMLKDEGIINQRLGEPFHYSSVQNILRNLTYTGVLRSGEIHSEVIPDLQIIPPELFQRVQLSRAQRTNEYYQATGLKEQTITLVDGTKKTVERPELSTPRKNVGVTLLSGNVYCGHCGGRIFSTTGHRSSHNPGVTDRIPIYKCYNRTQHKERCDGQTTYRAERVDAVLNEILHDIFAKAKQAGATRYIDQQIRQIKKENEDKRKALQEQLSKSTSELRRWSDLMLDSLDGKCVFSPEQIKERMGLLEQTISELQDSMTQLKAGEEDLAPMMQALRDEHQRLLTWAEVYDSMDPQEKKVIASAIFKTVTLSRDYGISIEFTISEVQYLNGMELKQ